MINKIKECRETLDRVFGTTWSFEAGEVPCGTRLVIELQAQGFSAEEILHLLRDELRHRYANRQANAEAACRFRAEGKVAHKRNPKAYDENGRRIRAGRKA